MATKKAFRAMPWTLLDFGDLSVCFPAQSRQVPASARIAVHSKPPGPGASTLVIELFDRQGKRRRIPLASMSAKSIRTVIDAESVVVVEEDPSGIDGRRFAYVAHVEIAAAATTGGRT